MKSYSINQYQELLETSRVLEEDRRGVKVLLTSDGKMVKLFRLKRFWSSALFKPYAVRFAENASKLSASGIRTVAVRDLFYCSAKERHLVFYDPVPGDTLRDSLAHSESLPIVLEAFARFLAEIHEKGVLFRSVHFGNIIVLEGALGFGLIDIADMKIGSRPLSVAERARNFRHMTRYEEDVVALKAFGVERFIEVYLEDTCMSVSAQESFRKRLARSVPLMACI